MFQLPAGYGFRRLTVPELRERNNLMDLLQIYEHPRRRGTYRYIVSADVSDGLGLDRSSVDVIRCGTIEEPAEQVAHFLSDQVAPMGLAYVIDAVGHLYHDRDQLEAMAAIECNNHGLSTQDTLQLHLGYAYFYRWEYYDNAYPDKRWSNKIGWVTTQRTRPILLDKFKAAITTLDPITGLPDLILNSKATIEELTDFQTETNLAEAAAASGAFDDCVMSAAIGNYVAWRLAGGESEPLEEKRRRLHEQELQARLHGNGEKPDFRNTAFSSDEMAAGIDDDDLTVDDGPRGTFFG